MHDLLDMAMLADRLHRNGTPFAVAMLVNKSGSSYRKLGARMLVAADGAAYGMISGGCLEGEVTRQALDALRTGAASLLQYDLSDEHAIQGFGTGCPGSVDVFVAPSPMGLDLLLPYLKRRQTAGLAHVYRCAQYPELVGECQLFLSGEPVFVSKRWPRTLRLPYDVSVARSVTLPLECGNASVFIETVTPPVQLIVFGTGADIAPLVTIARTLRWQVTVAGAKSSAVLRNLAPGANSYVFLMHPDQALEYVRTDRRTAAVVMNHNMARDTALVRALLRSPVPYIGLLGPRTRCATAFARAGTDDGDSGRIFGPVGLDIGADTPQEIALSIVAEIQAALTRAGGGSLRSRPGAVHQNQAACAT